MSRLAKSSRVDSWRATRSVAFTEGNASAPATWLASTCLMPHGCGLVIPRLDGIPREQQLWQGEHAAARLAHSFLEAGVVDADDWIAANHNPFEFLKRALECWLSKHDEPVIREQFSLDVLLSTSLDRYFGDDRKVRDVSRVFLALEPDSAGYVILGPTLGLLEGIHPRLPATFLYLFLGALNRWIRVYDFCCRQQKSYFVAIPVMWRRDTALPQTLVRRFISALTYFRTDDSIYLASQLHFSGIAVLRRAPG